MADDDRRDTLLFENPRYRDGFTQIENIFLDTTSLSRHAQILYIHLRRYAWKDGRCFPGYDRLRDRLGCGRTDLAKWIRELVDARYITVKRQGQGKPNLYTILDLPLPETSQGRTTGRTNVQKSEGGTTRRTTVARLAVPTSGPEEDSEEKDSGEEKIRSLSRHILQELRQPNTPRHRASVAEKLSELLDENVADWARVRVAVDRALGLAGQTGGESEFWRVLPRILAMER